MLAKPEYFSPPDEACCWPGRHGEEDGGTVAEIYREDVAGRGGVAELLARAPSGRDCWQAHRKECKRLNG
ncbi:MAG: hypothetical protein SPG81_04395 [Candidatus Egerieousia sp.]|nr:hypothetical protein [Candidatus Egerieousia sp.]